jgi:hypothetical protein
MAWECSIQTIFENGIFGKAAHPDLKTLFKQHSSQSLQPSLAVPQQAPYKTWYELVRLYTSRKLTFDKDRLIAAAGLAQSFRTAHPGEYLAGIWKGDLPRGLLWDLGPASRSEEVFHRPGESQMPSWSWAATLHGVYYGPKILDQDVDDTEAWFDLQIQACQVPEGGAHKAFQLRQRRHSQSVRLVTICQDNDRLLGKGLLL